MNCNGIVQFISQSISKSELGMPEAIETTSSEIPCRIEKVGITEHYQAETAGVKADVRIKVFQREYAREPFFQVDINDGLGARRYKVTRAQPDKGFTVIVGVLVDVDQLTQSVEAAPEGV